MVEMDGTPENDQPAEFHLEVEFDAANLSFEDIALVQSRVMAAMLAEAAQGIVQAQEPQGLKVPIPHVKLGYSRHSKGHTKYSVAPETELAEDTLIGETNELEVTETYLYVDGYPAGYRPPKFSKSHSKHTKVIIGVG